MKKANLALVIGAIINFILCAGHLICLLNLDMAFSVYDMNDEIDQMAAEYGSASPYILTIVVAICFFLCGIYALSACGKICKLPLLKLGIFTIATIFLLRAFSGIPSLICDFGLAGFISALIAGITGLLYLIGGIRTFRRQF